jgi:hypothetical protein
LIRVARSRLICGSGKQPPPGNLRCNLIWNEFVFSVYSYHELLPFFFFFFFFFIKWFKSPEATLLVEPPQCTVNLKLSCVRAAEWRVMRMMKTLSCGWRRTSSGLYCVCMFVC